MNADDLRAPLTERERAALIESCDQSEVPVEVTDPVAIGRVATLLPDDGRVSRLVDAASGGRNRPAHVDSHVDAPVGAEGGSAAIAQYPSRLIA